METDAQTPRGPSPALISDVADWLMEAALGSTPPEKLLEECSLRLNAAGISLWRSNISFQILHPQYDAMGCTWYRETGLAPIDTFTGDVQEQLDAWHRSPAYYIIKNRIPFLRRRLTGPDALLDFPVLEEYRDGGATDYLVWMIGFQDFDATGDVTDGVVGSWTTDRPGGFSDEDLQELLRIQRRLAVACKMTIREQITHNVLNAYLGKQAGGKVLEGQISLGDIDKIYSVIWFSDLRNSTPLADALAPDDFLSLLNEYFECTAGSVMANGGEVLRFIGDAVLAIFPFDEEDRTADGNQPACCKALDAADEAERRLEALNKERVKAGKEAINLGIGLHVGDLMFGNIGVADRVEFSVIGPAANEAARLENLTKTLGRRVVVSDDFVEVAGGEFEPLGQHSLRGVGEPMGVFAPTAASGAHRTAAE